MFKQVTAKEYEQMKRKQREDRYCNIMMAISLILAIATILVYEFY